VAIFVFIEITIATKLPSVSAAPLRPHIRGKFRSCASAFIHRIPTGKQNPITKPDGAASARQISATCHSTAGVDASLTGSTICEYMKHHDAEG
jgi:hypothetical protein